MLNTSPLINSTYFSRNLNKLTRSLNVIEFTFQKVKFLPLTLKEFPQTIEISSFIEIFYSESVTFRCNIKRSIFMCYKK